MRLHSGWVLSVLVLVACGDDSSTPTGGSGAGGGGVGGSGAQGAGTNGGGGSGTGGGGAPAGRWGERRNLDVGRGRGRRGRRLRERMLQSRQLRRTSGPMHQPPRLLERRGQLPGGVRERSERRLRGDPQRPSDPTGCLVRLLRRVREHRDRRRGRWRRRWNGRRGRRRIGGAMPTVRAGQLPDAVLPVRSTVRQHGVPGLVDVHQHLRGRGLRRRLHDGPPRRRGNGDVRVHLVLDRVRRPLQLTR